MKNTINMKTTLLLCTTLALVAFLPSCSPDDVEPEKTVDRSKLTDKEWKDERGSTLYFASDGKYNDTEGSWQWYPTGDSMQITSQFFGTYNFYFDYITDTEMAASELRNGPFTVYTTSP